MRTDGGSRRLPLHRRAFTDRRAVRLSLVTLLGALGIFIAAKLWFPRLDKAIEWVFGVLGVLLLGLEVTGLVLDARRRRRPHPFVPKPLAPLSRTERIAATAISNIVLDFPAEVAQGRATGDLTARLRDRIDSACALFLSVAGETPETFAAFKSQLARILAGGETRLVENYVPPQKHPGES